MGGIIQPILALLLVFMREEAVLRWEGVLPQPEPKGLWAVLSVFVYLALVGLSTRHAVRRHLHRPVEDGFALPGSLAALHFALFAALLWTTDWIPFVILDITDWPVISTLIAYLPYMLAQAVVTAIAYDALPASRKGPGKRWALVVFQVRVLALPVLPIVLISGLRRLIALDTGFARVVEAYLPLWVLVLLATMFVVFSAAPLIVRYVLLARPLPEGPLRRRLEAYCSKIRFRPTDILVWNTGGTVTNALFIGILPFLRYVVLTDALIARLDDAEVEAVFAHEAGHGKRRHTQLYLLFAAGFSLFNILIEDVINRFEGSAFEILLYPLFLGWILFSIAGFFLIFGWMSRRFETEADIFAMTTLDDPSAFPRALEAVGLHAGSRARKGGLRHFGIGTRIALLNRYLYEPGFSAGFDRLLRLCRGGILTVALGSLLLLGLQAPRLMREGDVEVARLLYRDALISGHAALAERGLEKAREHLDDPEIGEEARRYAQACLWILAKDALTRGAYDEARGHVATMWEIPDPDPIAAFNRRFLRALLDTLERHGDPARLQELSQELRKLMEKQRELDKDSAYEDLSDLYLALCAAGGVGDPPDPERLTPTARLLHLLHLRARGEPLPAGEDVPGLVEKARGEGAYRLSLFRLATGGLEPEGVALRLQQE